MAESSDPDSTDAPEEARGSLTQRLRAFLADGRRARRERVLARRLSRESLRIFRSVETQLPQLTGAPRYRAVIARQAGLDEDGARRFIERAEDTFASWPEERPIRFRDVVQYLVVERWLAIDPGAQGFRSDLAAIVAKEIPEDL